MAKGIVVVDIPENRKKCPLYDHEDGYCMGKYGRRYDHIYCLGTDTCCPIKNLPKKKSIDYTMDDVDMCTAIGWNACIDEILRE